AFGALVSLGPARERSRAEQLLSPADVATLQRRRRHGNGEVRRGWRIIWTAVAGWIRHIGFAIGQLHPHQIAESIEADHCRPARRSAHGNFHGDGAGAVTFPALADELIDLVDNRVRALLPRKLNGAGEGGEAEAGEDRNDRYHDHQLGECEAPPNSEF